MRPSVAIIATAIAVSSPSAQQSVYSSVGDVAGFASRLKIDQHLQDDVFSILNVYSSGNNIARRSLTDRAALACQIGRVVFGSKLYTLSSPKYGAFAKNNWLVTAFYSTEMYSGINIDKYCTIKVHDLLAEATVHPAA